MTGRDLFTSTRPNDLPPRWDGYPVEWRGWHMPVDAFICPPPRQECCPSCGSLAKMPMNRGVVWAEPGTVAAIGRARMNDGKHLVGNLIAFRCPDCGHDQVLDRIDHSGDWWDLDPDDYLDEGSYTRGGR